VFSVSVERSRQLTRHSSLRRDKEIERSLPLSSVLDSQPFNGLLRHDKNKGVERSQFPPSVLGSCALLHRHPSEPANYAPRARDLSRHARAEITTISALGKAYACLSATRREFGPIDHTSIPVPWRRSTDHRDQRIRRSLKRCTIPAPL